MPRKSHKLIRYLNTYTYQSLHTFDNLCCHRFKFHVEPWLFYISGALDRILFVRKSINNSHRLGTSTIVPSITMRWWKGGIPADGFHRYYLLQARHRDVQRDPNPRSSIATIINCYETVRSANIIPRRIRTCDNAYYAHDNVNVRILSYFKYNKPYALIDQFA